MTWQQAVGGMIEPWWLWEDESDEFTQELKVGVATERVRTARSGKEMRRCPSGIAGEEEEEGGGRGGDGYA